MNLVQSPISTVSASPVSAEMPRRQPSRSTVSANRGEAAHLDDLLVEAISGCGRAQNRVEVVVERGRDMGVVETLPVQPGLVQPGPGLPTRVEPALTQQQFGQPVTYPHQIRAQVRILSPLLIRSSPLQGWPESRCAL